MAEPALVSIEIIYARKVNWSQVRAGIPPVLQLKMLLSEYLSDRTLEIDLSVDGFTAQSKRETVLLCPSKPTELKNIRLNWDFYKAVHLSQTRHNTLRFKIRDSETNRRASIGLPLDLLALTEWDCAIAPGDGDDAFDRVSVIEVYKAKLEYALPARLVSKGLEKDEWDWKDKPPLEAAVVSLIFPTHPEFNDDLESEFNKTIRSISQEEDFRSQTDFTEGPPELRKVALQAAYSALVEKFPRAFHTGMPKGFHKWLQPIRLPEQILSSNGPSNRLQRRGATCIDYALLFCGWLEHIGMKPLLILSSDDGVELHAIAGVWLKPPPQNIEPILDRAAFFKHRDDIAVVDITSWTLVKPYIPAEKHANDLLNLTEKHPDWFGYAVSVLDARGLHPDYDSIEPLPLPGQKKRATQRQKRRRLLLTLVSTSIIVILLIIFREPLSSISPQRPFQAEITHLNDMAVIQRQAEIISGGGTVEFNLVGKTNYNKYGGSEVFVLLEKTGDPDTQLLGPAQWADDSWSLPTKLSIDGGGLARFELFPFVVEQPRTMNEMREHALENNLSVKLVMRKASLAIEEVSHAGAYAHVCGKAVNLTDGIKVDVETTFTTLDDWKWREKTTIKDNAWKLTDVPLRDPNQSGGNVKLRVVLPRQEGILLLGTEIIAEHKQHIALPDPQLRITECDAPPKSDERNAAELRPPSSITIRGEAKNALVNDTIWALVVVSGAVNGQNHIWPDRGSIILTEDKKRKENGVINWTQSIPISDVGYAIKDFKVMANISTEPPPADLKITLATEGQSCQPKTRRK